MKENVLYWMRVVILTAILLFILVSCTAWAAPIAGKTPDASLVPAEDLSSALNAASVQPPRSH